MAKKAKIPEKKTEVAPRFGPKTEQEVRGIASQLKEVAAHLEGTANSMRQQAMHHVNVDGHSMPDRALKTLRRFAGKLRGAVDEASF